MKGKLLKIVPILLLLIAFTANAQSIKFIQYTDQNGNLVTSNIPRSCVSNGVLVCYKYYPVIQVKPGEIYKKPSTEKTVKPETKMVAGPAVKMGTDGICYSKGVPGYEKAKVFEPYSSLEICLRDDDVPVPQ